MNGYQHICTGIGVGALAASAAYRFGVMPDVGESLLLESCFMLGTLLPDIDNPNSLVGRYFYLPVGHRRIIHTAYAVFLFLLPGLFFSPLFALGFGVYLHLFFDSFSPCGISWWRPYSGYIVYPSGAMVKKGFHFVLYRGEASAWVFALGFAVLCVFAAVRLVFF